MVYHEWNTHKNEVMNASMDVYTPKGNTYQLKHSLDIRVAIVAGVQNLGYQAFWMRTFSEFDLELDMNLVHSLRQIYRKKGKANDVLASKAGKAAKSRL